MRGLWVTVLGLATAMGAAEHGKGAEAEAARARAAPPAQGEGAQTVRPPAVAGLFYPKDREVLIATVDRLLAARGGPHLDSVRALVCPHAGLEYSGPVAARAYQQLAGGHYDTVLVLAASHAALFSGVCVSGADAYETPLGRVPVSPQARKLASQPPFQLAAPCRVQRPAWSERASRTEPPTGQDTPETWEHSIEVQLPFLQRVLPRFELLPVTFGRADPQEVARKLAPFVDDRTLVIASSDLSHYLPYEQARALDQQTLKWIGTLEVAALQAPEAEARACGRMPILTLLYLAKQKGWQAHVLDDRNSGDTAGDKRRVVGYGAVAFTAGSKAAPEEPAPTGPAAAVPFPESERRFLLDLARRTLVRVTAGQGLPEVPADTLPPGCRVPRGCFVTLTKAGRLRGCIGNILPVGPLHVAVRENARNAALRDPRFAPVTAEEVSALRIEISVLTVPEPLVFGSPADLLAQLEPHRDGIVLRIGGQSSTFLPQVWEQLPDPVAFLDHLAAKAGREASAWRGPDVSVSRYHVEAFEEPE